MKKYLVTLSRAVYYKDILYSLEMKSVGEFNSIEDALYDARKDLICIAGNAAADIYDPTFEPQECAKYVDDYLSNASFRENISDDDFNHNPITIIEHSYAIDECVQEKNTYTIYKIS